MTSSVVPVLALLGLPLLGAVATGGGLGPVFALSSVLAAVAAAVACSRGGLWWVTTGTPVVVLLIAVSVRAATDSGTGTTAALAAHALSWTSHAFPVMAAATAAALVTTATRAARGGAGKGRR
jgi:hypothetical protein